MRVAIAEDSGFFRSALVSAVESLGHVVALDTDDTTELLTLARTEAPDVVLLDICLPPTKTDEGLRAAIEIRERHPAIGVLVLSAYLSSAHVSRLLAGGRCGMGCLSKDQLHDTEMLREALDRLASGGTYIDPDFVQHSARLDGLRQVLTGRELTMLQLVAEGCSNQAIATRLHVNVKTVESTLTSTFRKLEISTPDTNVRVLAALTFLTGSQSFETLGRQ